MKRLLTLFLALFVALSTITVQPIKADDGLSVEKENYGESTQEGLANAIEEDDISEDSEKTNDEDIIEELSDEDDEESDEQIIEESLDEDEEELEEQPIEELPEEEKEDDDPTQEFEIGVVTKTKSNHSLIIIDDDTDNDSLFANYVEQAFNSEIKQTFKAKFRLKSSGASSNLNAFNKAIYDELLKNIKKTATGELESTIYVVDLSDIDESFSWTKEELGVDLLVNISGEYEVNPEAIAIIEQEINLDPHRIIRSLMLDVPYEFYWYDKTTGARADDVFDYIVDENHTTITLEGTITFKFNVAEDFRGSSQFSVDKNIGTSISDSISNAKSIVERHKNESEYQRIISYRDEICGLTSYNDYAAENDIAYGNPWQLIWVFDGIESTTVVCEGYSKAFQYLCDLSNFTTINSIIASGNFSCSSVAGSHMWNIVRMDDDNNYLVDLTNTDVGAYGSDELFLVGIEENDYYSSVDNGYDIITEYDEYWYGYKPITRSCYTDAQLTLAKGRYSPTVINTYTVTFKDYDDSIIKTLSLNAGDEIVAPVVSERLGYTFTGWDKSIPELMPEENLEFKAQYTINTYKISYDLAGGAITQGSNPSTYTVEDLPITLVNPVKQGYEFKGWTGTGLNSNTKEVVIPVNSVGDRSYTAIWPVDATYTVKHYKQNLDGSYPESASTTEVIDGFAQEYTDAKAKSYVGFTVIPFEQKLIQETNDTVIEIFYQRKEYTITWNNDNGDVLKQVNILYGNNMPEYNGDTPLKDSTAEYTYTFKKFVLSEGEESDVVIDNVVYTATFDAIKNKYTIRFVNYDDTLLQSSELEYGSTPVYKGALPSKEKDQQYTYTFTGWDKTVETVKGNTTYKAVYSSALNSYTITWNNENGTLLKHISKEYGELMPAYDGDIPKKDNTAEFTYTFKEFVVSEGKESNIVIDNVVYIASYTATKNRYTIRFVNYDDTLLQSSELEYGSLPVYSGETPSRADDDYTYTFVGWEKQLTVVNKNETYKAVYDKQIIPAKYTVVYSDGSGKTIQVFENLVGGSNTPKIDNPERKGYTFEGWLPEVKTTVTQDIEYVAAWKPITYSVTFVMDVNDPGSQITIDNLKYDESIKVPNTNITKSKYDFMGFSIEADGSSDIYAPGSDLKNITDIQNKTIVLYPVWAKYVYEYVVGSNTVWTIKSGKDMEIKIKRSINDEKTFDSFVQLQIDGTTVPEAFYKTSRGSLICTISSEYLDALNPGKHSMLVIFKDGEVSTEIDIKKKTTPAVNVRHNIPSTGVE